jgi:lipopolysaccharide biosynthesis glycosyltransferase
MKDKWLVTSSNDLFIPGVRALFNSARANIPGVKLALFYYGDTPPDVGADRLMHNYIGSMPEVKDKGVVYDRSTGRTVGANMYARLLIPELFDGKVFWADADACILRDISEVWEMDMEGYPTGSVDRGHIGWPTKGYAGLAIGTGLFDCDEWNRTKLLEHCWEMKRSGVDAPEKIGNVEGLIMMAHRGKFLKMHHKYNALTYYGELTQQDSIAHFAGFKPWMREPKDWWCNYADLWQAYHDNSIERAQEIQLALPTQYPSVRCKRKGNRL